MLLALYKPSVSCRGAMRTGPLNKHWGGYGERVSDIHVMCVIYPFPLGWIPFVEPSCILQMFSHSVSFEISSHRPFLLTSLLTVFQS